MKLCSRMMLIGCTCIATLALSAGVTYGQNEACCLGNGNCQDLLAADCSNIGGTPQGVGTSCAADDCLQACCLTNDTCVNTTVLSCMDPLVLNGTPQGPGTLCMAPEACCLDDGTCVMVDPLCCDEIVAIAVGGSPQGAGTACSTKGPVACCFTDGSCQDLDPLCCEANGGKAGVWGSACQGDNNGNNIDDACEEVIPAVSDYGLIALLLLTAVAGVIVIHRSRRGHATA